MANTYFYTRIGDRSQYLLSNNTFGWGPLSHVQYMPNTLIDFRGVKVGIVMTPQQLGVSVPYPQYVRTTAVDSSSGSTVWRLTFGEMPQFNTIPVQNPAPVYARNPQEFSIEIGPNAFLGNNFSGLGIEPRFLLGRYSPVGSAGVFAVGSYPAFMVQAPESLPGALSHPGFNGNQSEIPSTLNALTKQGLFPQLAQGHTNQGQL